MRSNSLIAAHFSASFLHNAICLVSWVCYDIKSGASSKINFGSRSIVGSGLGGTLAEPVKNYPTYFAPDSLFDKYPYLLPNLVCATVVVFGLLIGILFLEETHEDKKNKRDRGLEIGRRIIQLLNPKRENGYLGAHLEYLEETQLFLRDENHATDFVMDGSTPANLAATDAFETHSNCTKCTNEPKRASSIWQAFTMQMLLLIIGYGILAL